MSQTSKSLTTSQQPMLQSLTALELGESNIESRKRARRLSINNRELLLAVSESNFEKVEQLLKAPIDINFIDKDGNTALDWAIEGQNLDIINLILQKMKDVKYEKNKILIERVKNLNRPDIVQALETALDVKVQMQDEKIIRHECKRVDDLVNKMPIPIKYTEAIEAEDQSIEQVEHEKVDQTSGSPHYTDDKNIDQYLQQLNIHSTFKKFNQLQTSQQNRSQKYRKKQVTAIHGYIYQLKLLMLFLYRGVSQHYSFQLGTEIAEAKKFDDLVFEYVQNGKKVYRLLQAKHKQDESKKITAYNLLTEKNGDYNLVKYFLSYQNSKNENLFKGGLIKDVTVCTNIDYDYEDLRNAGITVVKMKDKDDVLDLKSMGKQSLRYKFGDNVIVLLKSKLQDYNENKPTEKSEYYTDIQIKDFLDHLVFAVNQPNEEELGKIVEEEMGKEFGFITTENVYNKLFIKILNWLKDKKMGRFLSYKEGREFFEEARSGIYVWFNVKNPIREFVGRYEEMKKLHQMLQNKVKNRAQFICVSGLGGVGKSELVRQYVHQYSQQYDQKVIWINAESYATLVESFRRLARDKLKISVMNADSKEKEINSIVEDVYKFFSNGRSLFIFDNAEKYRSESEYDNGVQNFLPSLPPDLNKPYVLITSRNNKWPQSVLVLQLDVFNEDEATEFIKKFLHIQDKVADTDIKKLVKELHCLPLALQQTVAYVNAEDQKLRNIGEIFTVNDYLKKYEEKAGAILDVKFPESIDNDYTKTVFTTWNVTLDMIRKKDDGHCALEMLYIASYLAPEDIPAKIFMHIVKDKDKLGSATELLRQYSMINLEHSMFNVHRLVQQVIRIKLKRQNMEEEVLSKALKLFYTQDIDLDYINHALSICVHANTYKTLATATLPLSLFVAQKLFTNARYNEAYTLHEQALQLLSRLEQTDDVTSITLATKNNMGLVCIGKGKYNMAIKIYEEVLCRLLEYTGGNLCHYNFIIAKSNLALALLHQGEYDRAMKYYQEVYDVEISSGNKDAAVNTKADIAGILIQQGKTHEALSLLQEVCNVEERILGVHHPSTLSTKNKIAYALVEQGKLDEALKILKEVNRIEKITLKEYDPHLVNTMVGIAAILTRQKKYTAALEILQDLLKTSKKYLGENHITILNIKCDIGMVLYSKKEYDNALHIFHDMFDKLQSLYPDDPLKEVVKNNIGLVFAAQGKHDAALKLFKEINDFQEAKSRKNYCKTTMKQNIVTSMLAQGRYKESLDLLHDIFKQHKKTFGIHNPQTVQTKHMIESVLSTAIYNNDVKEIRSFFEKDADITVANFDGAVLLHCAICNGNTEIVNVLLMNGASADALNSQGETTLHVATFKNYKSVVEVILQHVSPNRRSSLINAKTPSTGDTALHIAAVHDHSEIAKLLLQHGGIFNLENNNGKTPLNVCNHRNTIKLLKLVGELFEAANRGNVELISNLNAMQNNEFKAVINARNNQNNTLLQILQIKKYTNLQTKYLKILRAAN